MENTKTADAASAGTEITDRLSKVKNRIMVLSGKGGVGKSTFAVNLASSLAQEGNTVGLLDADIHGPSIPTLLGITDEKIMTDDHVIIPVNVGALKVMSLGFLLKSKDDPVIWRGPMKTNVIKQFLQDVQWGELDYLIVDCPPGTGDEPLSVFQLIGDVTGAVIVTTPQEVAAADVRKSINFCIHLGINILGIVENMSGFMCPGCGKVTDIFNRGGGRLMADMFNIPFLGTIPIDPLIGTSCDEGTSFITRYSESLTNESFSNILKAFKVSEENIRNNSINKKILKGAAL